VTAPGSGRLALLPREGEKVAEGRMRGWGAEKSATAPRRFVLRDVPSSVSRAVRAIHLLPLSGEKGKHPAVT
jgi:hypothetical protein